MALPLASDVSARVQTLIAFHEKGDKRATARRLGIDVRQLTGLLSGDWRQFSLDALGALVLTYGVSIDWLLALPLEPRPRPRPATRARADPGEEKMTTTMKVEADRLAAYFDMFTKDFLRNDSLHAAAVEVLLTSESGDQVVAEGAHLTGITYDPHTRALEFYLESGEHRVYQPKEVRVEEEEDGFVRVIEVVRPDGTKEVVRLRRLGLRPRR